MKNIDKFREALSKTTLPSEDANADSRFIGSSIFSAAKNLPKGKDKVLLVPKKKK